MLIEAFGKNNVMLKMSIYQCYNEFLNGREEMEDKVRMGRPPTARNEITINTARCIMCEEHRITVLELTTQLHISVGSAFTLLWNDLMMTHACCRWIPCVLTHVQMEHRVDVCCELLERFEMEGLYDLDTKQHSS